MLAAMTFLILAQAYAEASIREIPCYDKSDYPSLTGTGTQDDPYILSADKCLRIVNSDKDKTYYAKFSLNNGAKALSITAVTTDNKSCKSKNTEACVNKEKHVLMSVKDSNGNTRQCITKAFSWQANCYYTDYRGGIKKGDYFINLNSSDSERVDLIIKAGFYNESNFNSGVN